MTPSASRRVPVLAVAALLAACSSGKPGGSAADLAAQGAINKAAGDPCNAPPGMSYPSPVDPLNSVEPGLSPKAKRAHQNGCAGVKFRLAADGTVRDAVLVTESPREFGFGQGALEALAETRYGPQPAKSDFYYLNTVFVQPPPGQAPRPPGGF